ncbi:DUF262 domain-containing protein [Sphingobacterium sp.]|uniref:DUF262 domain-containing protein n=1 Tax=Sphingobacterium sp. TaxID=341027 RepID=UPI002589782C|nr:DUF262 domain-containing protein [Sphingobacterium sp.]WET69109.1 MAG: DUF262 domain-containing protein [Sphingobacterium sp.]
MPLSLSAEQKELLKIFKIEEQYIIPSYQRPYSWEYDHCNQLYTDIKDSFDDKQDYFIGNIIIAKAENNKDILEVVDGQQRLITTLLFFKVLSLFQPEFKVLTQIIEKEDWEGQNKMPRIRSDVFEANDGSNLNEVLAYSQTKMEERFTAVTDKSNKIVERLCNSKFECNILYFYSWIKFFIKNEGNLKDFTSHILKNVFLLPIELSGATQDEANEKALVIFETINNRGMNLEDADIFKAKLYNRAKKVNEEKIFIELWTDFKNYCDTLNLSIDDVFRFYSHIIRGRQGITSSETNLREFFTNEKFSPFENSKYRAVLEDLFKIIGILELLNQEKVKSTEAAKWIQIIEAYTNQYPKYAIVNYLFVNNSSLGNDFVSFLMSLTRYIYYLGSTTTVKFEIYNIIKQTSFNLEVSQYLRPDITTEYFNYLGRLKKGFALLSYYLSVPQPLPSYNVDKILNLKDEKYLPEAWNDDLDLENVVEMLGNYIIIDLPKKNIIFTKKPEYYNKSNIQEIKSIFKNDKFSPGDLIERDETLKNRLLKFFRGI